MRGRACRNLQQTLNLLMAAHVVLVAGIIAVFL